MRGLIVSAKRVRGEYKSYGTLETRLQWTTKSLIILIRRILLNEWI